MGTIANGKNTPVNKQTGTIPNVGIAMLDWFQPMVFGVVTKATIGFQVVETVVDTKFLGVLQPLSSRALELKPEGQRAWTWLRLHSQPVLSLNVDDVVIYQGKQTRVMARKNFTLYGYIEYELVQDWTGSGPTVTTP